MSKTSRGLLGALALGVILLVSAAPASASTTAAVSRPLTSVVPNASGGGCTTQSDWGGWNAGACISYSGGAVIPDAYINQLGVSVPSCSIRLDLEYNSFSDWTVYNTNWFSCSLGRKVGTSFVAGWLNGWRTKVYVHNGVTGNNALIATSPTLSV